MRVIVAAARFAARLELALRYCLRLNYPWRRAWVKAERS